MSRFDVVMELILNPQLHAPGELGPLQLFTILGVATLCSTVIYLIYRFFNRSALYSESFNILLILVGVITAFIILSIGTNLVLSLGMVGALSIVRFRTAIKDPLDVGFIFWSVSVGLASGAQMLLAALLGTAFIAVLYVVYSIIRLEKRAFLMVLRYANDSEESVQQHLTKIIKNKSKLKNKTIAGDYTELTVEVKVHKGDTTFLEPLRTIDRMESVVLVEFTGDYA